MTASARWSIVMPVLNEAAQIESTLAALQPLRTQRVQVIVADGGSSDATPKLAQPLADQVVNSARGRARQMNAGAAAASAPWLLFLHADTVLPPGAVEAAAQALASGAAWGRFDVHIEGRSAGLAMVAAFMNTRSRLSGIATGDQALFMTRSAFDAVGGFPDQPLMEDIEISRQLKRTQGQPACLRLRVRTSGRRWDQRGLWRTIVLMWWLRLAYWLGVLPERLAQWYR